MEKLGVGVIGVGTFGTLHARLYNEHPYVDLLGVADLDEERANTYAHQYHTTAYTGFEELLADPAIRAVSIVLPDHLHRAPAIKAAEAGKHILIEKPLAMTVDDGKAIIDAAERNGVKLMVDFMNRWSPPFSLAKHAIENGDLGELLYLNMRLNDTIYVPTKMLSWAANSSVLWFLGSHVIDLVLWLVDDDVERVSCVSRSRVLTQFGIDTPDFYHSVLEFQQGAVANIENSWILPESGPTVFELTAEIVGTDGKIEIDTARNGCIIQSTRKAYSYPDVLGAVEVAGRMGGFAHTAIDHFVRCVIEDKEPAIPKEAALMVTEIITQLEEADRRKQPLCV